MTADPPTVGQEITQHVADLMPDAVRNVVIARYLAACAAPAVKGK